MAYLELVPEPSRVESSFGIPKVSNEHAKFRPWPPVVNIFNQIVRNKFQIFVLSLSGSKNESRIS